MLRGKGLGTFMMVSLHNVSLTKGSKKLFSEISLGLFENEKIGLLGPNGAGKSSLLKLISKIEIPDQGEVSHKKNLKVAYVAQNTDFPDQKNILEFLSAYLKSQNNNSVESRTQASITLSSVGFNDFESKISSLSGGWRKRLAIAKALSIKPDLLILDEPTNHMDWDGILWLEKYLHSFKNNLIVVSHDRHFLQSTSQRIIEINPLYKEGYLSMNCDYKSFLEHKKKYIENQIQVEATMSNKARREYDWLKAGVKARTTKSKQRIDRAHDLIKETSELKSRNQSSKNTAKIKIDSSLRRSKKLIEFKNINIGFKNKLLIENLNLSLGPKTKLGILGPNACGKTSLIKAITNQLKPLSGKIDCLDEINIVYFDQKRESLPQDSNIVNYLGDGSDYIIFQDESIHVASYAKRFLFPTEKLQLNISQLSGGEQARLLIAKLLLQPADILILDEPTNDLDIETIEVLEEALQDFQGLAIIVSHDRFFLSKICNNYLALNGKGEWTEYSSLEQWLKVFNKKSNSDNNLSEKKTNKTKQKLKLSYKEKKQLENIESEIKNAENLLDEAHNKLNNPQALSEKENLEDWIHLSTQRQKNVDELYSLWDELEKKSKE